MNFSRDYQDRSLTNPAFIKQDSKPKPNFDEKSMNQILQSMQEATPNSKHDHIGSGLASDQVSPQQESNAKFSQNEVSVDMRGIPQETEDEPNESLNQSVNNQQLQDTHLSIDINDSFQLEQQGLKRVQIEGYKSQTEDGEENNEFLMDMHGNIYDLNGNFVATIDNDEDGSERQSTPGH